MKVQARFPAPARVAVATEIGPTAVPASQTTMKARTRTPELHAPFELNIVYQPPCPKKAVRRAVTEAMRARPGRSAPVSTRPLQAVNRSAVARGIPPAWRPLGNLTVYASIALSACSTVPAERWRIEPVYTTNASGKEAMKRGYLSLARIYEADGRWDQAADVWRKLLVDEPNDPDLHTALGVALSQGGRHELAVAAFRRATELVPFNARALNNLGHALTRAGQDEAAANALREALGLDPTHAQARANLQAVELRLAGRNTPAVTADTLTAAAVAETQLADVTAATLFLSNPADMPLSMSAVQASPLARSEPVPAFSIHSAATTAALTEVAPTPAASLPVPLALAPLTPAQPMEPPQPVAPIQPLSVAMGPAVMPAAARVAIINGMGLAGAASHLRRVAAAQPAIGSAAAAAMRLQNLAPYNQTRTVVQYRTGFEAQAKQLARLLPKEATLVQLPAIGSDLDVRLVLGQDQRQALVATLRRTPVALKN